MVKMPSSQAISRQNVSRFIYSDRFREILTWSVPPVTPFFRYLIDKKDSFEKNKENPKFQKKQKKLLKRDLIRDASIISLGTAFYFTSLIAIDRTLKYTTKLSRPTRKFTAFLGALGLNVVYLAAIATKISKLFIVKQAQKDPELKEYIASQPISPDTNFKPNKNSLDLIA